MQILNSIQQSLFVNKQVSPTQKEAKESKLDLNQPRSNTENHVKQSFVIEGELINRMDLAKGIHTQALFARGNEFAGLSKNVQSGLQAYRSIDSQPKREAIEDLFSVDLYA